MLKSNTYADTARFEASHGGRASKLGTVLARAVPDGGKTRLKSNKSAARFEESHGVRRWRKRGEPTRQLGGVERLDLDTVRAGGVLRATKHLRGLRTEEQGAARFEQTSSELSLERLDELRGPPNQRDVGRMLKVCLSSDPGVSVTATSRMSEPILLKSDTPEPGARGVVHGP